MKKLYLEEIEDIRLRYENGESVTDITEDLGRARTTIKRYLRKNTNGEYIDQNGVSEETPEISKPATKNYLSNVQKRGFDTIYDYQKSRFFERRKRDENIAMSLMIPRRLEELDKNQAWLGRKMKLSLATVGNYLKGKSLPNILNQRNLFSIIEINHNTLTDYMDYLTAEGWNERLTEERKQSVVIAGHFYNGQRERLETPYLVKTS